MKSNLKTREKKTSQCPTTAKIKNWKRRHTGGTHTIFDILLAYNERWTSSPYNDVIVAMGARVTKETIEHLSRKNMSFKNIKATAQAAAIESVQCLCAIKNCKISSNPQTVVTANDTNTDKYLESSSEYTISSEEEDPQRQGNQEPLT